MDEKRPESQANLGPDARTTKWLVVRCQLGEVEAFEELVELWHPHL